MQCAACSEQLGGAAATSPSHAWCEVVVCEGCGATNWRCALCMQSLRYKGHALAPGEAGAYIAERWWGKHAARPSHKARDAERRARLADTGGSEPCDALLRAVLAVAPCEQQAAAARMGLPCVLLNTAYDKVF